MPEIKNNFTGAKMNQDLDERLIPKGEYREAFNIDVSSSEEDDLGAVQNAFGNVVKSDINIAGAKCIGSYVNKKDNTIIWFIKGDTVDAIAKYNPETDEVRPLLVDAESNSNRFLKFNTDYLITGINVIDDLLFWTDNLNEPRQLNINRHYSPNFTSTSLFKDGINLQTTKKFTQDDITVIKKYPLNAPKITLSSQVREGNVEGKIHTHKNTHKVSPEQRHGFDLTNAHNVFARGAGSHSSTRNITEETYLERAIVTTVVETASDVICFDPSESAVIGKQSSYVKWQAVRKGMRVRISTHSSNWAEPTESFTIRDVDYLNHRIRLNGQIKSTSLISANRKIRISEWSEPFNNTNLWQYTNSTNQVINKPTGVSSSPYKNADGSLLLDGGLLKNGTGTDIILAVSSDSDASWTKGAAGTYTSTNSTGSTVYLEGITPSSSGLINGHIYKISVTISRTGGSGEIGFSHDDASSAATGIGYEVIQNSTSTKQFNYIFKSTGKQLKIYASANTTGVITINSITCMSGPRTVSIEPFNFYGDVAYKAGDIVKLKTSIGDIGDPESDSDIVVRLKLLEEVTGTSNVTKMAKSQAEAIGDGVTGNDKVQNGDFSSTTGWSSFGGSSGASQGDAITTSATDAAFFVTSGALTSPNSEWGYAENTLSEALVADEVYKMTYSVTTATTGDNTNKGVLKLLLGTFVDGQHHCPNEIFLDTYTTGTKTVYWKQRAVAGGALSLSKIKLYNDTRWNGVIDNIVIKKATNTSYVSGGSYGTTPSGGRKTFNTEVISIDNKIGAITGDAVTSWTSLREQQDPIYEFEMPRFAYRWKYVDNEYSSFSPFTPIAFLPESKIGYVFDAEDGYNKAMFNNLRKIEISGFRNKPKDVIGLDLISKKSNETSVYVVKKYKKSDLDDLYNGGKITITKEEIKSLLPSNQLLRSYDNVPRKAKAQEVTANRLLYGNYVQQYNISDTPVNIDVKLQKNDIQNNIATKSIKSIRDYEVGVSYLDRFGRQTPVFSDESGVVKVGQEFSSCANSFSVKVNSKAPDWATHYKYWVKDASSEFYNIAMDRFYNAEEEENVWISFPSSDTSKVSIGDYIVIKKAHAKDSVAIQDNTSTVKYKVLDKESNAPDYIKYKKEEVGVSNSATTFSVGPQINADDNTTEKKNQKYIKQTGQYPSKGYSRFLISAKDLDGDTDLLDLFNESCELSGVFYDFKDRYVQFKSLADGSASKHYKTSKIYRKIFLNKTAQGTNVVETDGFVRTTTTAVMTSTTLNVVSSTNISVGMAICTGEASSNTAFGQKITVKEVVNGTSVKLSEKLTKIQEGQAVMFKDLYESFIFEIKESFGNDISFLGESPSAAIRRLTDDSAYTENSTVIQNPQDNKFICEFSKETQEGYGDEFKGKFFVKIKRDSVLNKNITEALATTKTWKSKTSTSATWAHSWLNDNSSGNEANVINYSDETNLNYHGAASILEDLLLFSNVTPDGSVKAGGFTGNTTLFSTHGLTFMINGNLKIEDYLTDGVIIKGTTAGFKEGALNEFNDNNYWINGYNGENTDGITYNPSMCIDSSLSWTDDAAYTYASSANSLRRGHGFVVGNTTCSFKFFGMPSNQATIGNLGDKYGMYNYLTRPGTQFRIIGDPTATVYSIVNVVRNHAVFNNHAGSIGKANSFLETIGFGKFTDGHASSAVTQWWNESLGGRGSSEDNRGVYEDADTDKEAYYNQAICIDLQLNKPIVWSPTDPSTTFKNGKVSIVPMGLTCANATFGTDTGSISEADTKANRVNHSLSNSCVISIAELDTGDKTFSTKTPAVFEVLPKERADLNLFYETPTTSIILKDGMFIRLADTSAVTQPFRSTATIIVSNTNNTSNNQFQVDPAQLLQDCPAGQEIEIGVKDANGDVVYSHVFKTEEDIIGGLPSSSGSVSADGGLLNVATGTPVSGIYNIPSVVLDWHNCFSFGNGVESNRLFDDFNAVFMDKGPVVSTILEQTYEEDHRKYSMIYSGIYNETSGVNRLNQFIQAEKITKDLNPDYGSIQKLFTRNTNVVVLCEDKTLKVLANKDALFNADGNPQLIATNKVLGQTIPFAGEYGISTNPESFANFGYRMYYADRKRNAVLRLSGDGITDIAAKGMSDFFKDNLSNSTTVIGGYDEGKDLYNITLNGKTVSFTEKVNGWTSLKSFIPENSISVAGNYYSFSDTNGDNISELWLHNKNLTRMNFYGVQYDSSIKFVFNDAPGSIKSFKSINYEGTSGWKASAIATENESGSITTFVEKEGKYFNFIQGDDHDIDNLKLESFSIQGIGSPTAVNISSYAKYFTHTVTAVDIASNIAPKKWNLNNSSSDSTGTDLTSSFNDDNGSMAQTKTAVFYVHPQIISGIQWNVSATDFAVNITNSTGINSAAVITQDGIKVKITVSYSGSFPNNNSSSTITISSGTAYQTQQ